MRMAKLFDGVIRCLIVASVGGTIGLILGVDNMIREFGNVEYGEMMLTAAVVTSVWTVALYLLLISRILERK
jgi:hypothetical protein